jgi:hypothetical protein
MKANLLYLMIFPLLLALFSCGGEKTQDASSDVEGQETTTALDSPTAENTSPTSSPTKEVMPSETIKNGSAKDAIAEIRAEYTRLQQLLEAGTLRKDTKAFNCDGDPTEGELIRYYEDDKLVVMQHNQGSEHSWESKQIYLENAVPFFALEEEGYWTFGGPQNKDETSNTIDYVTENRYYFQNGELIRQLTKKYETHSWEKLPEGSEVPNKEVDVISDQNYQGVLPHFADFKKGRVGC